MNYRKRASGRPSRVAEPVQVYLPPEDQDRLARLTQRLDTTKSDVLRRGLEALEREVCDPLEHPVLEVVGLGASSPDGTDPARAHDAALAEGEIVSWGRGSGRADGA